MRGKILYYSGHEILEYDEIRLLRGLGYSVFSLGTIFDQMAPAVASGDHHP